MYKRLAMFVAVAALVGAFGCTKADTSAEPEALVEEDVVEEVQIDKAAPAAEAPAPAPAEDEKSAE